MATPVDAVTVLASELRVGTTLPADVVDSRNPGVPLLSRGTPVTTQLLDRLKDLGVREVSVDAESAAIIRGRPPSPPSLPAKQEFTTARQSAAINIKELFAAARQRATANGALAKQVIAESVEHMLTDIDVYLRVVLQTSENCEVHEHCLAAAQLAMSVGCTEDLPRQAVLDLGTGCLMSRIGQSHVAMLAAGQMRPLNRLELLDLKRTPCRTFDCLQGMGDISVGARAVAYQIFERFDGSGYPRGRSGSQINPLARIASVCDVYVALTSPRPHRAAFEPYSAVELLIQETCEGKFDPLAMRALLRTVGLFPIGSFVRLTDGSIGQVVRNHREMYDRPVVHLFFDGAANLVQNDNRTIDLQTRDDVRIDWAVSPKLIDEMMNQCVTKDQELQREAIEHELCDSLQTQV